MGMALLLSLRWNVLINPHMASNAIILMCVCVCYVSGDTCVFNVCVSMCVVCMGTRYTIISLPLPVRTVYNNIIINVCSDTSK
jgi:hypothetical protein